MVNLHMHQALLVAPFSFRVGGWAYLLCLGAFAAALAVSGARLVDCIEYARDHLAVTPSTRAQRVPSYWTVGAICAGPVVSVVFVSLQAHLRF